MVSAPNTARKLADQGRLHLYYGAHSLIREGIVLPSPEITYPYSGITGTP